MNSIARYRKTLHAWGLTDVPFRAAPPESPDELSRIFYGRQQELDLALPALYEGRNVLVRGLWGLAKPHTSAICFIACNKRPLHWTSAC